MGENEDLKAMKCEACGGDIVKSYRVEDEDEEIPVAKCLSCGHEYDQYSQEYYEYFASDFTYDKDTSIFKLGLKGVINDIEYEIIGRIRYQEEDEYEKSTWDEWLAVSSDGVYHYFNEEEGEVHSYEEYTPESIDLESSESSFEFDGKTISKDDGYIGRIVYAEGELPWKPEIGEPVTLYDFKKDGIKYTIEQSEGEVSITRGDKITYKEIIDGFGQEEYKEQYNNTVTKRNDYRKKGRVYLIVLILTLVFSIYNCGSSDQVQGIMKEKRVFTNNELMVEKNARSYMSQVLYGPFKMTNSDSLHDVTVSVDETIHRMNLEWQSFRLLLLKDDRLMKAVNNQLDGVALKNLFSEIDAFKEPVESFMATGNFWDEEGTDSEGYYWHENDLTGDADFVLDEAGQYYVYLELFNNKLRKVESVKVSITKVKSVRYYVIIMIVLIILMLINKSKATSYNELPFELGSEG